MVVVTPENLYLTVQAQLWYILFMKPNFVKMNSILIVFPTEDGLTSPLNLFIYFQRHLIREQVVIILDIGHIETLLTYVNVTHHAVEHPTL